MTFIFQQILFFISIALVLFVPGYFLALAIWGKRKILTDLEKFIISFGLSIVIIDFLMILTGKIGIPLNAITILLLVLIFAAICFGIYKKRFKKEIVEGEEKELTFSKNQIVLIILIVFLTLFIKTIYLTNTIFPTSTDLGHHMYWSKQISQTGELPVYEKMKITETDGNYQISQPQPIADFIIGEHLIFSAINLISRIPFISYFPSLVLLLINMLGIMATFILTLRLFKNCEQGKNISIFALLLLGPLYTISSSQAKFVSGGVVGNILGNFLIPLSLYFYFRALKEKSSVFLTLALFTTAGIFYTHHLSALVFVYIFAFTLLTFIIFNLKNIIKYARNWLTIVWSRPVIIFIILASLFVILIYTPSYIETGAVETAVGGPSKATRAGLTFTQLKFTAGEARMVLGIIGLFMLLILRTRKTYASAFLIGWVVALLLMSLKPQWLYLDIPSNRIANYISYPLSVVGAFAFVWGITQVKNIKFKKYYLSARMLYALFLLFATFAAVSGLYDNSQSLKDKGEYQKAVQTFNASDYLVTTTGDHDIILKDHNYIIADAWIKLFFTRDYSYPLSRGFFKRYEDEIKKREMCTLWMISTPNTANGKKCLEGTGTNFIMVNPAFDGPQFEKSKEFWKIYSNEEISVYYKNL